MSISILNIGTILATLVVDHFIKPKLKFDIMKKERGNKMTTVEKTPAAFYCVACACPSVFETDRGTYIIVGKKLKMEEITQEVKNKIGEGEIAVEIPKGLLDELTS